MPLPLRLSARACHIVLAWQLFPRHGEHADLDLPVVRDIDAEGTSGGPGEVEDEH